MTATWKAQIYTVQTSAFIVSTNISFAKKKKNDQSQQAGKYNVPLMERKIWKTTVASRLHYTPGIHCYYNIYI